jgi:hypothetical protein
MVTRSAILKPETEVQLAGEMLPLWRQRPKLTAKQIAEELNFGEKPYEKLKKYHVYFYREKFNKGSGEEGKYEWLEPFRGKFRRRKKGGTKKGHHRYKHEPEETMPYPVFRDTLNDKVPIPEDKYGGEWYEKYVCRKRAYLILHYWSPLRRSEIIERKGRDFKITRDVLKIVLYRKKKYYKKGAKPEPFFLTRELPLADEVVSWVRKFRANERPFDFSGVQGWRYVKDVFTKKIQHRSFVCAHKKHSTIHPTRRGTIPRRTRLHLKSS